MSLVGFLLYRVRHTLPIVFDLEGQKYVYRIQWAREIVIHVPTDFKSQKGALNFLIIASQLIFV